MAQQRISLAMFSLSLVVLILNLGENSEAEPLKLQTWCVAKPSAMDDLLSQNIEYACNHLQPKACDPIKQGSSSPCYDPNTAIQHASYAMNAFYQRNGRHPLDCNFDNSGLISLKNPSQIGCVYQGRQVQLDTSASGMWCVASPSTDEEKLQNNIDYVCNHVDCSIVKAGGACFDPDNVLGHASVAMNLHYQANGRLQSACNFNGTGLIVTTDPSYGNCVYQYRQ